MAKVDLSLKLVYANNLYQEIIRNTIEDYNPGDFTTLLLWLDSHNVIIDIDYEFYKEGINWLWSIDFYNPENEEDDCINYGTAVFGDNGEYKTRSEALCISIIRALELYLLGSIKCGKVFSEDELFINDIDPRFHFSTYKDILKRIHITLESMKSGIYLREEQRKNLLTI